MLEFLLQSLMIYFLVLLEIAPSTTSAYFLQTHIILSPLLETTQQISSCHCDCSSLTTQNVGDILVEAFSFFFCFCFCFFHLNFASFSLKFFFFNLFNWRLITLQYYIGFAIHQHESTTGVYVLPIWTPSSLSPRTILLGHPSAQAPSPKHPVSCIEPELAIRFLYDIKQVVFF